MIYWIVILSLFVTLLLSVISIIGVVWFVINIALLFALYIIQTLFFEDLSPPEN